MVKLEETKDRRRLHIGSIFVDLNETDYRELIKIFSGKSAMTLKQQNCDPHKWVYQSGSPQNETHKCSKCDLIA